MKVHLIEGGAGSGFFAPGHKGRKGRRGGSSSNNKSPELVKSRIEAKERLQQWLSEGMTDEQIILNAYKFRESHKRNPEMTWNTAMWDELRSYAESKGYVFENISPDEYEYNLAKKSLGITEPKNITKNDIKELKPFVNDWKSSEYGFSVPKDLYPILEKFTPDIEVTLYKGVKDEMRYDEDYKNPHLAYGLKLGGEFSHKSDRSTSWTTNRKVAESFMVSNGSVGKLTDNQIIGYSKDKISPGYTFKRTFKPKEILFSFDIYDYEARRLGLSGITSGMGSEGEMITKPGEYGGSKVVTYINKGYLVRDNSKYYFWNNKKPKDFIDKEPNSE